MVRVRFAPSPTGYMHVGNLRAALYNQFFAMRNGGDFLLRIEDTDRTRLVEDGVLKIARTLEAFGVVAVEGPYIGEDGMVRERGTHGPYVQSERLAIYAEQAKKLIDVGHAYFCFCSSERLEEMKAAQAANKQPVMYDRHCRNLDVVESAARAAAEPHVIRMKMPMSGTTVFTDMVRGEVKFANVLIDDQVLMKSDGFPTYHLANVVDDRLMEITQVIRGEDWLSSTPKHLVLYEMFGWTAPSFAHLPLLLNPDKSKLSKRQGDVAAEDFLEKGYLPEALINFLALQGWNPSADREIYTKEEMAGLFDLAKVNKSGAVFNREKLDWFNREYLKMISDDRLYELAVPFLKKAGIDVVDKTLVIKALGLERVRLTTLAEFPEAVRFCFEEPQYSSEMLVWKKSDATAAKLRLEALVELCGAMDEEIFADKAKIEAKIMALIAEQQWGNGDTLWPMRVALSGREKSPGPFEIAMALGKEKTVQRLRIAAAKL